MTGYALDIAALEIGAVVIAVDCEGANPTAFAVIERDTHHVVGRDAGGRIVFVPASLVVRMASPGEAAAFRPATAAEPAPTLRLVPRQPEQIEMF
jgi:hypothetical protein